MRNIIVSCLLVLSFASLSISLGQTTSTEPFVQDWQELNNLESGKPILVELKSGAKVDARFIGLQRDSLKVSDLDGLATGSYQQKDIKRVYLAKSHGSRKKRGKIGAIIGGILGLVIAAPVSVRIDDSPSNRGEDSVAMAVGMGFGIAGAGAGYGIGYMLGGTRKSKLLYESR